MPNKEIMTDAPSDKPPWMTRLLIGAVMGAFFGALHLWFHEVSFARFLAAVSGSAALEELFDWPGEG